MEQRDKVSTTSAEWKTRVNLAALYRVFEYFGWTDLTYSHISARVPGDVNQYLIHAYGLLFDEVAASNLIKVDFDGHVLTGDQEYSEAGHLIHTLVLSARPEINYVLHSHTRAGIAVSAMECGLLPISEHANAILGSLGYHSYGVIAENSDSGKQLVADLGGKYAMILRNHGLLTCGRTSGEAFLYHYFLQLACEIQVDVVRSSQSWVAPAKEAIAELSAWGTPRPEPWGSKQWNALLRMLHRRDPSFEI